MKAAQLSIPGAVPFPATLWTPENDPDATILMGHGLGVDRFHVTNQVPARLLVETHNCAVLAVEIPLHGERVDPSREPLDPLALIDAWQQFWANGGFDAMTEELKAATDALCQRFPGLPIGYWGISLGTQYGVPFLAREHRVRAAALGLFGGGRVMAHYAPRINCPVCFIQQLNDEIHPREATQKLFDAVGSGNKTLEANPGGHQAVPMDTVRRAADFLVQSLCGTIAG